MQTLWQDVRFGFRMVAKNPGFSAIAILTLALGIGANTAIFSLLNQILLRRLPVKNPGELVILHDPGPATGRMWNDGDDTEPFPYPIYKGLRDNNTVLDGLLARSAFAASVSAKGQTDRASGELVSGNYFDVLGVHPALGRLFSLDDDRTPGAQPVVVLGHGFWMRNFAGDSSVLNKTILVNNTQLTVVGVVQAGFTGVQVGQVPDLFVPLMMKASMTPDYGGLDEWNYYWLAVIGRLKPGVSAQQAKAGLDAAYLPLLEEQLPKISGWDEARRKQFLNKRITLSPGAQGRQTIQRDSGGALSTMFVMVTLVLLIACANIANLLIARGASRQREFAIRTAIGASRWRMIRQLLIENLICAVAGGALGLMIASWAAQLLVSMVVSEAGIHGLSTGLDGTVLAFAVAATLVSGLFFGLIPAWRVTRTAVSQTLKDQGATASAGLAHVRFRKTLVAAQVAFTVLLLAGAGLFARTLWNLRQVNIGLRTDNVIAFSVAPSLNGYNTDKTIALVDRLRERLAALPGVTEVGTSQIPTLTGTSWGSNITVEGGAPVSEDDAHVHVDAVSPEYLSTLGVHLFSGRDLRDSDAPKSAKVAVISESMAKRFFPGRNPLGMHFAFGAGKMVKPNIEIVGVAKEVKQAHVRAQDYPFIYLPYSQQENLGEMTVYIRTAQDPLLIASTLRQTVSQLDSNLPVYDLKTVRRIVDEDLFAERLVAGLSVSFGVLAALLAAIGIYGVLAYLVVQRTREIGIRMALGAKGGDVRKLILGEIAFMAGAGIVVGLPLAFGLAKLAEGLLYGVHAYDPAVFITDVLLILAVAVVAWSVPAWRATRVDPMVALRHE